ncbi:hypothetical protein KQX54_000072, partial [Cotesia glomerata]
KMLKLWKRSGPIVNPTDGLKSQAFIRIHSLNEESHWKTIDGSSPSYIDWSQYWSGGRQPSSPSYQKCGSLLNKGRMDDVQCHYKLAFFCEK